MNNFTIPRAAPSDDGGQRRITRDWNWETGEENYHSDNTFATTVSLGTVMRSGGYHRLRVVASLPGMTLPGTRSGGTVMYCGYDVRRPPIHFHDTLRDPDDTNVALTCRRSTPEVEPHRFRDGLVEMAKEIYHYVRYGGGRFD